MGFEKSNLVFKFGEKMGFVLAWVVFTSALYFVLTIIKKNVDLIYVAVITTAVAIIGLLVKRLLK